MMTIIRQIEEMEYIEQVVKSGVWSSGLEGRVGNTSGKVGEKRRFGDAYDTGWDETTLSSRRTIRDG